MGVLVFWLAGIFFTIGFAIMGEGGDNPKMKLFGGERFFMSLFAFVIWPLMLGVHVRELLEKKG
ncbi:hypothetical protein DFR31_0385 [Alkalispirillum mobile]|uniref:Uncharacterized protein n=1 Tax=Alkalispirillum mobile TaxID=85925 RepID=A0A498C313_9GAMM|nr:hypothetical protein [Alkalispirillum mobile]RLK50484.1 hypothetical protein DFR31_0385 [Alkalispirillum mobile]